MSAGDSMGGVRPCFLDACIPIYAAGREHEYKEPCARIILAAGSGDLQAVTDVEVVQEIAYRDRGLRRPQQPTLAEDFLSLMEGGVLPVTSTDMTRCLALLRDYPSLSPRDAVHIAVMLNAGVEIAVTADRHFDLVREVERVDPMDLRW